MCSPTEDVQTPACLMMAVGVGEELDRSFLFALTSQHLHDETPTRSSDATQKCTHNESIGVQAHSSLAWRWYHTVHINVRDCMQLYTLAHHWISTFNTLFMISWMINRFLSMWRSYEQRHREKLGDSVTSRDQQKNAEKDRMTGRKRECSTMMDRCQWVQSQPGAQTGDLFLLLFYRTKTNVTGHYQIQDVKKDVCFLH